MRQFPRFVVPLLLFLILILVGSLLWLKRSPGGTGASMQATEQFGRAGNFDYPQYDASTEFDDARSAATGAQPESVTRTGPTQGDFTVRSPDLPESTIDEPIMMEAVATGAVAETASHRGLNARVHWIDPPPGQLGFVTPPQASAHYNGPATRHPEAWAHEFGDEWLLIGIVRFDGPRPDRTRPAVIQALGRRWVANAAGYFLIRTPVPRPDWPRHQELTLMTPGYRLRGGKGVELAPDLREQRPLDLEAVAVPGVALRVVYTPRGRPDNVIRAWFEIYGEDAQSGRREPGLFMEADVPVDGALTFLFPDPATWTAAPVRMGAACAGLATMAPISLQAFKAPPGARLIRQQVTLSLTRTDTIQVSGRNALAKASEMPIARVISHRFGARTITDAQGEFKLWMPQVRAESANVVRIDPVHAAPFDFATNFVDDSQSRVRLAQAGSVPTGPWLIAYPAAPVAPSRSAWLYVPREFDFAALYQDKARIPTHEVRRDDSGVLFRCPSWPEGDGDWHVVGARGAVQPNVHVAPLSADRSAEVARLWRDETERPGAVYEVRLNQAR